MAQEKRMPMRDLHFTGFLSLLTNFKHIPVNQEMMAKYMMIIVHLATLVAGGIFVAMRC